MLQKTMSFILGCVLAFSHVAGLMHAASIDQSPPCDEHRVSIAANPNEILYGEPVVEYKGVLYEASSDGISAVYETKSSLTAEKSSSVDNLNAVNGTLYYTVFENSVSSIRSLDPKSGKIMTLLDCGSEEIRNMYVVNGSYILYLAGGNVYKLDLSSRKPERVSRIENVRSFIPSSAGNIYAVGSVVDSTIYVDEHFMIDGVDYYSIIDDNFVFSVNSNLFQVKMTSLAEFCNSKNNGIVPEDESLFSIADDFDMYGSVAVNELLNEEDVCEECAEVEPELQPDVSFERAQSDDFTDCDLRSAIQIPLNERQRQIYVRASNVVNLKWTCLQDFHRWFNSNLAVTADRDFIYRAGVEYTGLPYSRPGRYNTYNPGNFEHIYIGFSRFEEGGPTSTLQDFSTKIQDSNDRFWERVRYRQVTQNSDGSTQLVETYKYYGPLYGLDCGRFLSYSWNIPGRGTGNLNCEYSKKISEIGSRSITLSDLALLRPGDALVSANQHAILVTNVWLDSNGSISALEIMEETPPLAKRTVYTNKAMIQTELLNKRLNDGSHSYEIYRLVNTVTLITEFGTVTPRQITVVTGKKYGKYCSNEQLPVLNFDGLTFLGWYTSGGIQVTSDTIVTEELAHTLTARWEVPEVCITLDGNEAAYSSIRFVELFQHYGDLPDLTRTGYIFDGWYSKAIGGERIYSWTKVTNPLAHSIYAQWKPISVPVSFNGNGGVSSAQQQSYDYGGPYSTLPTASRNGYLFSGWYTSPSGGSPVTSETIVISHYAHTLYAHWQPKAIVVSFDANGGELKYQQVVHYNQVYGTLPTASRKGYTFAGWYTAKTGGTRVTETTLVTNANNHTLYARWTGNSYKVTLQSNGGAVSPASITATYGKAYGTLPTPTKTGYYFSHWNTKVNGSGATVTSSTIVNTAANHTLYAIWVLDGPAPINIDFDQVISNIMEVKSL